MKVLFIGGTGVISSACSELAVSRGIDLYHLNRGKSAGLRQVEGVKTIISDIRDVEKTRKAIQGHHFDAVVDWIAFEPRDIRNGIALFSGKTDQFVFISSASAYQTPPEQLPITEDTPLENPFWEYSRNKIACENLLREEFAKNGFPYTIVRPSHTYDKTKVPLIGGYTALHRMKQGLPLVVHGDGTSLWTLTHHKDFAVGLVGLLGKKAAINEALHITSDEWLPWNNIYRIFARELQVEPRLVHVPSDIIARYDKATGDGLLGDKAHSMIFDNAKIRSLVPDFNPQIPFREGVKEIVKWHGGNPELLKIDEHINGFMDRIVGDFSQFLVN
ncbi:MAG: NAD-dependent epimerase/dehydratase family protein [Lewinellaceae bacterium]|nr:NAD-dependent epimerase/dehydratase family protein [Lewinellaceae bacterium]